MASIRFLFTFKGRIPRKGFWAIVGVLSAMLAACGGLIWLAFNKTVQEDASYLFYPLYELSALLLGLILWIWLSAQVRRWHDLGHSAWFVLLGFVPAICFFSVSYLGICPGTSGDSRYGADPIATRDGGALAQSPRRKWLWPKVILGGIAFWLILTMAVVEFIAEHPEAMEETRAASMATRVDIEQTLPAALTLYRAELGEYPSTEAGLNALLKAPVGTDGRWHGPYLDGDKVLTDPWGDRYRYRCPGHHNKDRYDLWSELADNGGGMPGNFKNW